MLFRFTVLFRVVLLSRLCGRFRTTAVVDSTRTASGKLSAVKGNARAHGDSAWRSGGRCGRACKVRSGADRTVAIGMTAFMGGKGMEGKGRGGRKGEGRKEEQPYRDGDGVRRGDDGWCGGANVLRGDGKRGLYGREDRWKWRYPFTAAVPRSSLSVATNGRAAGGRLTKRRWDLATTPSSRPSALLPVFLRLSFALPVQRPRRARPKRH